VADKLTSLTAKYEQVQRAVNNVVEARFENLQEVLTSLARTTGLLLRSSDGTGVPEHHRCSEPFASRRIWSRYSDSLMRLRPCCPGAYGRRSNATSPPTRFYLETTGFLSDRSGITEPLFFKLPFLIRGDASADGNHCGVAGSRRRLSQPAEASSLEGADGGLAARAGTLNKYVDLLHCHAPWALRAAFSAASCAANGGWTYGSP